MSNIDNLNFKVILDDSDFNERVKADIEAAKKLNTTVSSLLNFRKEFASAAKELADAMNKESTSSKKLASAYDELKGKMRDAGEETKKQSALLRSLKASAGAYFSVEGARRFVSELARVTGEFEKQQVALRAILQDTSGADALFEKIKSLAVESPFSVLDLTSYAKQLSAFSVPLDEIYDTTKMLADVSAGLGVDMSRIVLAYGQIRSASFLRGQEVRQLTEAGIPILDELSKQFSELEGRAVSVGEVFDKISAREVPFQMVEKAFKDMTSEGGKFYQMQEVLADTLAGKISNLKDSFQIMLSSMGEANSGILKGSVDLLTSMMNNYENIGKDLIALAASYGTYKLVLYATEIKTKGLVKANLSLVKSMLRLKAAILSNPYALIAGAAVAAAYGIYRLVTATTEYEKTEKALKDVVNNCNVEIDDEISKLDFYWKKLADAKAGTDEYNKAKDQLYKNYGQYLSDLDKEKIATGDLASVYDDLAESIRGVAKSKAFEQGSSEISDFYKKGKTSINKDLERILKDASSGVRLQLREYVEGSLEPDKMTEAAKKYYNEAKKVVTKYETVIGDFGAYSIPAETKNQFDALRDKTRELKSEANSMREDLEKTFEEIYGGTGKKEGKKEDETFDYKALSEQTEDRISLVKEMAAAYSKMKDAGIGDNTIRGKFDEVYPEKYKDLYESFDFNATLDKLEAQLSKTSSSVVRSAKSALRREQIDTFTDAFTKSSKALSEWIDFYKEIDESMPESSEDSFGARVQRILNKLSASNYKTGDSADKAMENLKASETAKVEADGQQAWEQYYNDGVAAIQKWAEAAKQANRDVAQQAMQSLGKSYLDTFFTSRGIDMTNLNDKSFGQLQTMLDSLKEVDTGKLIPEDVVKRAEELGVNIQPMMEFIEQAINAKEQDVLGAMFSNISEMVDASRAGLEDIETTLKRISQLKRTIAYKKENGMDTESEENDLKEQTKLFKEQLKSPAAWMDGIAKATKTAAGYMKELADATGNTSLSDTAEQMSAFAQNLSAAADGYEKGGFIGMAVEGIMDAIDQTISGIAQAKAYVHELNLEMKEFRSQLEINDLTLKDSDYETPFGTKSITKAMDASKKATEAMKKYNEYANEGMDEPKLKKKIKNLGLGIAIAPLVLGPGGTVGDANQDAYGTFSKVYTQKSLAEMEAYVKGYNKLQGMMVKTSSKNGWQKFWGAQDKYTALKDLAPELWDENGEFNTENAETFLKTNKKISDEQKQQIQHAIDLKKAYDDAIKAIDEQISDTFGSTASDLTDIIFDSVINGSDAWEQFREKGSEAILELGKQLMQEMMISEYLDTFKDQLREAYKSDSPEETQEKVREITADIYGGLMNLIPSLQESAESWVNWMRESGFDPTSSSGTLSEGIKSITEDTANLLASYLNAIRSDVSQIRLLHATTNEKLSSLLDTIPKAPTLADYLTKIEAHTANISADTSAILKQLRSVITTQGGSSAFAVYM